MYEYSQNSSDDDFLVYLQEKYVGIAVFRDKFVEYWEHKYGI
jgi:hypothetical protein